MTARIPLFALLSLCTAHVAADSAGTRPPRTSSLEGFKLRKTTSGATGTVERWERPADGALLTREIIPQADEKLAEARLKAVNAHVPSQGVASEQLMFRYQTSGDTKAWTNYRATHHATFKTYRFWKLQNGKLVMAHVSFPRHQPDFDAARRAFITAKKAADSAS